MCLCSHPVHSEQRAHRSVSRSVSYFFPLVRDPLAPGIAHPSAVGTALPCDRPQGRIPALCWCGQPHAHSCSSTGTACTRRPQAFRLGSRSTHTHGHMTVPFLSFRLCSPPELSMRLQARRPKIRPVPGRGSDVWLLGPHEAHKFAPQDSSELILSTEPTAPFAFVLRPLGVLGARCSV
jgi:hypothetical protein